MPGIVNATTANAWRRTLTRSVHGMITDTQLAPRHEEKQRSFSLTITTASTTDDTCTLPHLVKPACIMPCGEGPPIFMPCVITSSHQSKCRIARTEARRSLETQEIECAARNSRGMCSWPQLSSSCSGGTVLGTGAGSPTAMFAHNVLKVANEHFNPKPDLHMILMISSSDRRDRMRGYR